MEFVLVDNDYLLNEFVKGLNAAFLNRSNDRLPYEEFKVEGLTGCTSFVLCDEQKNIVGGISVTEKVLKNNMYGHILHVWVNPNEQNKGIGKKLLLNTEKYCIEKGYKYMSLGVSNIYKPAVMLYKKFGFKKCGVYANVPNTCYFFEMRKVINGKDNNFERVLNYYISKIKFFILFKKDSTPKILHKILFPESKQ